MNENRITIISSIEEAALSHNPSSHTNIDPSPSHPAWSTPVRAFLARWSLIIIIVLFIAFILLAPILFTTRTFDTINILLLGVLLLITMLLFLVLRARESVADEAEQQLLQGFHYLRNVFRFNRGPHGGLVWSPRGDRLAISTSTGTFIWGRLEQRAYQLTQNPGKVVAWSPDGILLAIEFEGRLSFYDTQTSQLSFSLEPRNSQHYGEVIWSPDGKLVAVLVRVAWLASFIEIELWNTTAWTLRYRFSDIALDAMAWSPDGLIFAYSIAGTPSLWDVKAKKTIRSFEQEAESGRSTPLTQLAWSPDGRILAGLKRTVVLLWDASTGILIRRLEGHVASVTDMAFSPDGKLLATKDSGFMSFWSTDSWSLIYSRRIPPPPILNPPSILNPYVSPPASSLISLTTTFLLAQETMISDFPAAVYSIDLVEADIHAILPFSAKGHAISYTNAKVVLIGDSGVGKSGLGLVLSAQPFVPTESTHGRRVWTFSSEQVVLEHGVKEKRETLLWDLAGQPGYRLIHQLHLNEVTVALVVFDARSETDPLMGVYYWDRALTQARMVQGSGTLPLKKFLVAARADRGGIGVSGERIQTVVKELGFDGYFETSAKDGWQIPELREAIRSAVDWEVLPRVSSTKLFQQIKGFLVEQKKEGRLLATVDDLYTLFLKSQNPSHKPVENLREQFETCIGRVESAGLIKQLSFGNRVLLQPELLDAYASALVNAVKNEPDGLGCIIEERVRAGQFVMPEDERIKDRDQEKLLLIAMIEDLVRRDLTIREDQFLVFPSQSTRENPDMPDPEGKAMLFDFEGPVLNVYATLAVRLANSDLFKMNQLWKNAITYTPAVGGSCGLYLRNIGEGRGELTLFYAQGTGAETKRYFEEYVYAHLQRRTLPGRLKHHRFLSCDRCGYLIDDRAMSMRIALGFDWLACPVCSNRVSLQTQTPELSAQVARIDRAADRQRDLAVAKTTIAGKEATLDFDVFLCHHNVDKPAVKRIGEQLKAYGLLPWLDEWELPPGRPWIPLLEEQIEHVKSAAVFVGKDGIGPWQRQELDALLRAFVNRKCPVIPVLLEYASGEPKMPIFLHGNTWVDFRQTDPDPLKRLIWGITGKRVDVD